MTWTVQQKLDALMRLPWTLAFAQSEFGDYLTARVAEVPDAIATGANDRELARDLYASLRASLACRLEFGDPIDLPKGARAPWDDGQQPAPSAAAIPRVRTRRGEAWQVDVANEGTGRQYGNLIGA